MNLDHPKNCGVNKSQAKEPTAVRDIWNLTVALGDNATFKCVVDSIGNHKVINDY